MTDDKQQFADKFAAANPKLHGFVSAPWWGTFTETIEILGMGPDNDPSTPLRDASPLRDAYAHAVFFREGYKAAGGGDKTMREAFQYANHQLLQANKTLTNQSLVFAKHQLGTRPAELGVFTTQQLRAVSAALQLADQGDFTQEAHADIVAARVILTHALELRKSRA